MDCLKFKTRYMHIAVIHECKLRHEEGEILREAWSRLAKAAEEINGPGGKERWE